MKSKPVAGQYRASVTSANNTATSHTGKRDRAFREDEALVGADLGFTSGRRIGRVKVVGERR